MRPVSLSINADSAKIDVSNAAAAAAADVVVDEGGAEAATWSIGLSVAGSVDAAEEDDDVEALVPVKKTTNKRMKNLLVLALQEIMVFLSKYQS